MIFSARPENALFVFVVRRVSRPIDQRPSPQNAASATGLERYVPCPGRLSGKRVASTRIKLATTIAECAMRPTERISGPVSRYWAVEWRTLGSSSLR